MPTRYSLPRDCDRADTARSARAVAAVIVVTGLLSLGLWGALDRHDDPPLAAPPPETTPAQTTPSA